VPDGYQVMMRFSAPSQQHDCLINMQALTGFFFATYDGTLAQWKDYLGNTALLPAAFRDIRIDIDYGHRFGYTSKRMRLAFTPALQKIAPDSMLSLGFSYFTDHGKVVWDVGDVWMAANPHDPDSINIARSVAPSDDLDDSYKNEWNKIVHHQHPYDGVARSENDVMKITGVVETPADAASSVRYSVNYQVEGTQPQDVMKGRLDTLMTSLHVDEH
jgi:hypothetical protein